MERYEQLSVIGEGSYGMVIKCRHRDSDQVVAIKKFLETEEDASVRRMALREIRMLKKLKHENLVTMIEVFRYRKRFYLVFEYLEGTVLDELEKTPGGLGDDKSRERIFQVTRAIGYCHSNNIIHRDVKPENVLVSSLGVVKLCDFGFARLVSVVSEACTEYVATRWYRAPELLVGEQQYGAPVDIWAIGCLYAEMMTGDPLFPGESDIDQLYLIVKCVGKPCLRHQQLMAKNSQMRGMIRSACSDYSGLYRNFSNWPMLCLDFLINCLRMDPLLRPTSDDLLRHSYFTQDKFSQRFLPALREKVTTELSGNPLLRKYKTEILMSTDKKDELGRVVSRRRESMFEQHRWRMSLGEGSVKRKYGGGDAAGDSARPVLTKTFQKALAKPAEKNETTKMLARRPSSENKLLVDSPAPTPNASTISPKQYQSLQSFAVPEQSPSKQFLRPYNITFKEPQKKSPNVIQSIHNTSIKGTFNQVPLMAPRASFVKKLERNVILDSNIFVNIEPLNLGQQHSHVAWNSFNNANSQKSISKSKDTFTLPSLPGATSSPKPKSLSKPHPSPVQSTTTPRVQSSGSQKKANGVLPIV